MKIMMIIEKKKKKEEDSPVEQYYMLGQEDGDRYHYVWRCSLGNLSEYVGNISPTALHISWRSLLFALRLKIRGLAFS